MTTTLAPEERFWAKVVRTPGGCWDWTAARRENGYGVFGVSRAEGNRLAHRYSWELAHGAIPAGMQVCHHCDNRACVRPDHLFLGTAADNQRDMVRKGRSLRGERHNLAQLVEAQVLDIRRLWGEGLTQAEIAVRFNTTKANVSQIVRGKKWRHILPADWSPPAARKWSRAA